MFKLFMKTPDIRRAIEQSLPDDEKLDLFINAAFCKVRNVAIGATEKHLVIFKKGVIRRREFVFHPWNKFGNALLEESPRRGSLLLEFLTGERIKIEQLGIEDGRKLNGHARKYIARAEAKNIAMGKPCPYCSELVKFTAKICPHCHRDLSRKPNDTHN
jgi:hypothetical protein